MLCHCRFLLFAVALYFALCGVASTAEFIPLGSLPGGGASRAVAVSDDGRVVVGRAIAENGLIEAFRWTREEGLVGLGDTLGFEGYSSAWDVSADGNTIVGTRTTAAGSPEAFRMTPESTIFLGPATSARKISPDGSTIAGASHHWPQGSVDDVLTWNSELEAQVVPLYQGQSSFNITGLSGGGSILVGNGNVRGLDSTHAHYWSESTGMIPLGTLPNSPNDSSRVSDITPDGMTIVGNSYSPIGQQAVRWTSSFTLEGLGFIPGHAGSSTATAVSDDGAAIVGQGTASQDDRVGQAFIWTESNGMRDLQQVLSDDYNLSLTGWSLVIADDISGDGKTIIGRGYNPQGVLTGWVVSIAASVLGDYNGDGVLDAVDLDLQAAAMRAMTNPNEFDLTGDAMVDLSDRVHWVEELAGTFLGDADLDGDVDFSDFTKPIQ